MPNGGSVNQTDSSDFTTTSFGELSGLPSNLSISTVTVPSGDASTVVFAGDQTALAVAGIAICVVRGLAEHADPPGLLVPTHDAVVGNVAPQQATGVAEIDRALAPAHVGCDALDAGEGEAITRKTRIEDLDRRVRIALARLPAAEGCACDRRRADRAGADEQAAFGDLHENPLYLWRQP